MKIFKLLGLFLCLLSLPVLGKLSWYLIYSATSLTCLESKPNDSNNFGQALAINDNYIAVGDPQANRVAIYSYDELKNRWSRTREIHPPKNSIINRVGSGFGYSLVFHQNQLVIGAYSPPKTTTFDDDIESDEYKLTQQYHGAVYSLQLDKDNHNSLEEIALPDSIRLTGYSIAIFNNKIALGGTTGKEPGQKLGKIFLVNPISLQAETIIEPPSSERKFADFGFVIDGNKDFLLVGSRGLTKHGGALLIDKTGKTVKTIPLEDPVSPNLKFGSTVALTNNLIAIGGSSRWGDENTQLLKLSTKGWSLVGIVPFGGSLNMTESYVLISSGKRYGLPSSMFYRQVHALARLDENQPEIESEIHWKLGSDIQLEAKGLIYADQLLLSRRGKVILQSMKDLPSSYLINQTFCKEK